MTDINTQLLAAINHQNTLLEQLLAATAKPKTGFSDRPLTTPQWVFVGRNSDSCWYTLNGDSQQHPITQKALTGWIRSLGFEKVERRGKECHKLNMTVQTDEATYIVTTGHDTCFSKSLLTSIAVLQPQQLREPVTIAVAPGTEDTIVWCRLYAPEYVKAPQWDDSTDMRPISISALAVVKNANA